MSAPRIFDDPSALADAVARAAAGSLAAAQAARGGAHLMLCGGRSPVDAYRRLAADRAVDWSRVDVWFCDERAVPPDDDASNYRLALETLAAPAGVPLAHVHRMSAESADLDAAARAYDDALAPAMDVAILGIGEDGHVASLFPGSPWLGERTRRVAPVLDAPKPPPRRMTVTPPVLERAARVLVLAVGEGKADATAAALAASGDPRRPPARLVRAREWFVDRAAARGI